MLINFIQNSLSVKSWQTNSHKIHKMLKTVKFKKSNCEIKKVQSDPCNISTIAYWKQCKKLLRLYHTM